MPNRSKWQSGRKPAAMAVIGVLAALLIFVLDLSGVLRPAAEKAYDGLFYVNAEFLPPIERQESPVVLIGIDNKTFDDPAFHIPQTLWHNYFGEVIQGAADGGAKAVGLDFLLPRALFDELAPNYSRRWLMTIVYNKRQNAPLITGLIQLAGRQVKPQARYLQLLGKENVGLFNLTNDSDDFIRRQRIVFPTESDSDENLYSITYLLAKKLKPDLEPPSDVIYIDYDPAPEPFPQYSFAEVYHHAVKKDLEYLKKRFANKLVLIGENDDITQDRHATPLYYIDRTGHRRTPGVEILVHTVRTLIGDRFYKQTPPAAKGVIYLALALLVGFLTLYASPRPPLWVSLPALVVIVLAAGTASFRALLIPPLVGALGVVLVSEGAFFAYRYWVVDWEKRHVRSAFSRYLSPHVVAEVLENPEMLSLGGSRRNMSAFFSDIAGFTTISEKLAPEELVKLLNRYLSLMTDVIMESGGTVDKFEGDAVMAFWGAPLIQEDHAVRACRAALAQQNIIARFREQVLSEDLPEIRVRMGINTGPMVVGNMGSESRFDYTIMGDAVNLASRLEGANKAFGTEIMISQSTLEEARSIVEVRELDLLQVKGKNEPIRVYELLAEAGELPDNIRELRALYEEGLALYRDMKFKQALDRFRKALALHPGDGPSNTYVERCRAFIENPPPPDWDGVFTMTTK